MLKGIQTDLQQTETLDCNYKESERTRKSSTQKGRYFSTLLLRWMGICIDKSFTLFIVQSYLACSLALICCMSPFRCGEDSQISRLCYRPTLMLLH